MGYNMFAYCNNTPVNLVDPYGYEPFEVVVISTVVLAVGVCVVSYCLVEISWLLAGWLTQLTRTAWDYIMYAKKAAEPEPPDVTYPGDDPTKAPDGYEWRGPDSQGGERGGYANPNGTDSWHPDLNHPDGIDPHWDYNDGLGHKWRIFPNGFEYVSK